MFPCKNDALLRKFSLCNAKNQIHSNDLNNNDFSDIIKIDSHIFFKMIIKKY